MNKEEALELKRHKALAARRRTAYDKAVAELCASDFDERVEKALEAVPPRAAVVQGGSELALPARCCAIVGACLDWRLASRPVDAVQYARRAKSWRGVCAGARRTLDAGVLAPLVCSRVPFRRHRRDYAIDATALVTHRWAPRRIGPSSRARPPSWWRTGGT